MSNLPAICRQLKEQDCLLQVLPPRAGKICIDGWAVSNMKPSAQHWEATWAAPGGYYRQSVQGDRHGNIAAQSDLLAIHKEGVHRRHRAARHAARLRAALRGRR